jgi:hypothetical protein
LRPSWVTGRLERRAAGPHNAPTSASASCPQGNTTGSARSRPARLGGAVNRRSLAIGATGGEGFWPGRSSAAPTFRPTGGYRLTYDLFAPEGYLGPGDRCWRSGLPSFNGRTRPWRARAWEACHAAAATPSSWRRASRPRCIGGAMAPQGHRGPGQNRVRDGVPRVATGYLASRRRGTQARYGVPRVALRWPSDANRVRHAAYGVA